MAEDSVTEGGERTDEFLVGDLKLCMWIPAELAGRVVGKKGVVIANIQRETQLRLMNALQPVGSSSWVSVVMIGEALKVQVAYNAVADIVQNEVDDVVAEFRLQNWKRGYLLGNVGYQIVKKISADTNVRIYIPTKEDFQSMCSLEGTCENVYRALDLFNKAYVEILESKKQYWASFAAAKQKAAAGETVDEPAGVTSANGKADPNSDTAKEVHKEESKADPVSPWDRSNKKSPALLGSAPLGLGPPLDITKTESPKLTRQVTKLQDAAPSADNTAVEPKQPAAPLLVPVTTERFITIPSTLVGLLLARRPDKNYPNQRNVMNQIQTYTLTTISRIGGTFPLPRGKGQEMTAEAVAALAAEAEAKSAVVPGVVKLPAAVSSGRRRRAVADDDDESDGSDEDDDDTDDNSEDYEDAMEGTGDGEAEEADEDDEAIDGAKKDGEGDATTESPDADAVATKDAAESSEAAEGGDEDKEKSAEAQDDNDDEKAIEIAVAATAAAGARGAIIEDVPFRVTGMTDEGIELAISGIKEIIAGQRIKTVLINMKQKTQGLVQFHRASFVGGTKFAPILGGPPTKKYPSKKLPPRSFAARAAGDEDAENGEGRPIRIKKPYLGKKPLRSSLGAVGGGREGPGGRGGRGRGPGRGRGRGRGDDFEPRASGPGGDSAPSSAPAASSD